MKRLLRWYRGMVRLYPACYRADLGDEMLATFEDLLIPAAQAGRLALLRVCWRELRDLPRLLLRAYWEQIRKPTKELHMAGSEILGVSYQKPPTLSSADQPAPWREAILAGLPHAALALVQWVVFMLSYFQAGSAVPKIFEAATVIFAWTLVAVLVGLLVYAWRQGWPRWSGSYYLYAFVLLASPALYWLQIQDAHWAYRGMDILLGLVYILLLVGLAYWVVRRDALKGLLMLAPIAILSWWPVLEFIPGEIRNPLQLGMLVVTTLVVVWIARAGSWRLGMWALLAGSLVVGLPIAYFRTYFNNIPLEYADPASLSAFSGRYAQAAFWSLLLVVGPMLLWALRQLDLASTGGKIYPLLATSIFVSLGANLTVTNGYSMGWLGYNPVREWLFGVVMILSTLAYLVGILRLLLVTRGAGLLATGWRTAILGLAAAGLPLMFMLPMFAAFRYASTVMPFGLFKEKDVTDLLAFGLGGTWLVLGAWGVTGLRMMYRPGAVTPDGT